MLVQSLSKTLKSDDRFWDLAPGAAIAEVYKDDRSVSSTGNGLLEVLEPVIGKDAQNLVTLRADQKVIFLPLNGKVRINGFGKVIAAGEVVVFDSSEDQEVAVLNVLADADADVLVITFNKKITENSYRINQLDLEIRNKLNFVDTGFNFPGFIGVFDARKQGRYILKDQNNGIFGMVINGVFEFQNSLVENRDAILIWDLEELTFEALSENAIILFFEIPE